MPSVDLNLLTALDVLLTERSVTTAAKRLGLSPSAMSRTLARLRTATGDPLLVQAGRALAPTPYAEQLASRVHAIAQDAIAVLSPVENAVDPARLKRTFTIRANDGFIALFAPSLIAAIGKQAPHVRLRFLRKPDKDGAPLREGEVDLEIGTAGGSAPEVRSELLFHDGFVGVVRHGHPLLDASITPERYSACGHVVASRHGRAAGPVDDGLHALGLGREIVAVVPGFDDALRIARETDLVALVPRSCIENDRNVTNGLIAFDLPVATPPLSICAMWHPRLGSDGGHQWFREAVMRLCRDRTTR